MANVSAHNTRILIGGYHASLKARSAAPELSVAMLDDTAFIDESFTYIPGLKDSALTVNAMFADETAAGSWWSTLLAAFASDAGTVVTFAPEGWTAGRPAWLGNSVLSTIGGGSDHAGLVMVPLTFTARDVAAWGHVLTGLQTVTSTTNGTSVDNGAATTGGAVANLHVTAISGTPTLTVTVQDSADNSSWSTIGTFPTYSASIGASRLAITGNVRRYTRAVFTITGGSTPSVTGHVSLARL